MKIAHFGTFDVENYGDLLFPLILERRLSDICDEFVHVSPVGGSPIWEGCVQSVSFNELMQDPSNIDGVVIGGGNIIHASPKTVESYQNGDLSSTFAYPGLWLGASYIAAKDDLPLCWNASGVPKTLIRSSASLARWSVSVSEYVAVRDDSSKRLLEDAGVEHQISVVPDTALEVCRLWSREEIDGAYRDAFVLRSESVPERSIAVHLNRRYVDEDTGTLAVRLDRVCERLQATAILVALGPCHGDDALQREVAQKMRTSPLLIDRPWSIKEVAACIAGSEVYLGSSLHGMMTACSFGKRGMIVASSQMPKFDGFLKQFELSDWLSESWAEAERSIDDLLATPEDVWERIPESAAQALDKHWEEVRSTLLVGDGEANAAGLVRNKYCRLEELHTINRGYSGESEIFHGIIADNLISSREEVSRLKQQLSRRDEEVAQLSHWMKQIDGEFSALLKSRQWRAGRTLGEIHRRLVRKPRARTAADSVQEILQRFREWREGAPQKARNTEAGPSSD